MDIDRLLDFEVSVFIQRPHECAYLYYYDVVKW